VNLECVKCGYDSANWITRTTVYQTAQALRDDFRMLGQHIISVHAKDIWLENRLALHLQDGCPGKGTMDFRTLFELSEALSPTMPILVEGAASDELATVSQWFQRIAAEAHITITGNSPHP
jgi:sugar phosphate isomerase/epimerase